MNKDQKNTKKHGSAEQQSEEIKQQRKKIADMTRQIQKQSEDIAKLISPSDEDNEDEAIEEEITFSASKLKARI